MRNAHAPARIRPTLSDGNTWSAERLGSRYTTQAVSLSPSVSLHYNRWWPHLFSCFPLGTKQKNLSSWLHMLLPAAPHMLITGHPIGSHCYRPASFFSRALHTPAQKPRPLRTLTYSWCKIPIIIIIIIIKYKFKKTHIWKKEPISGIYEFIFC